MSLQKRKAELRREIEEFGAVIRSVIVEADRLELTLDSATFANWLGLLGLGLPLD